jgi:hypothetical protein
VQVVAEADILPLVLPRQVTTVVLAETVAVAVVVLIIQVHQVLVATA